MTNYKATTAVLKAIDQVAAHRCKRMWHRNAGCPGLSCDGAFGAFQLELLRRTFGLDEFEGVPLIEKVDGKPTPRQAAMARLLFRDFKVEDAHRVLRREHNNVQRPLRSTKMTVEALAAVWDECCRDPALVGAVRDLGLGEATKREAAELVMAILEAASKDAVERAYEEFDIDRIGRWLVQYRKTVEQSGARIRLTGASLRTALVTIVPGVVAAARRAWPDEIAKAIDDPKSWSRIPVELEYHENDGSCSHASDPEIRADFERRMGSHLRVAARALGCDEADLYGTLTILIIEICDGTEVAVLDLDPGELVAMVLVESGTDIHIDSDAHTSVARAIRTLVTCVVAQDDAA